MKRVTRRHPCKICGAPKWCGISEDEGIAICMHIADGAIKDSANGGYIHSLRESSDWIPSARYNPPKSITPVIASLSRRHLVFEALLDRLSLSGRHGNNLMARGLDDVEIAMNLYASVPMAQDANDLADELAQEFDLQNVPGFYRENGQWKLNVSDYHAGFFVPYRNQHGRIQSLQIRRDNGEPRYLWLSSSGKPDGTSSGAPLHFARPHRAVTTGEMILTEGALKADIIANQIDEAVIAAAGVDLFPRDFGAWLRRELPHIKAVAIAFDSDWQTKTQVERALLKLAASLETAGIEWDSLEWSDAKGLDDYLMKEAA
jgi:hypothetical protein